jgi:hypothetical protein
MLIVPMLLGLTGGSATADSLNGTVLFGLSQPSGIILASESAQPQSADGGAVVGFGYFGNAAGPYHAVLWTSAGAVDLNPTTQGVNSSQALATDGSQQVGVGDSQAYLWSGAAASAANLNPTGLGIYSSTADGIYGNQQVGYGISYNFGNATHAVLWNGAAASAVDLNPLGFLLSWATAADGAQQVGYGSPNGTGLYHPLLWSGNAASVVDLSPSTLGITGSEALGVGGNQQVGEGSGTGSGGLTFASHALLWTGTAASAVDLNPSSLNITFSIAYGTNGVQQVGDGYGAGTLGSPHALLWNGAADTAIDLQSLLPASGTWYSSQAYSIDDSGNIFGTAFGDYNGVTQYYAVEWSPIPEPTSVAVIGMLTLEFCAWRRRSPRGLQDTAGIG